MRTYDDVIAAKMATPYFAGIHVSPSDIGPALFAHQRDLVRWACRKGRAAVFADTGLGKSLIALEWARHVSARGRVLILTPLAVAQQFVREGIKWGIPIAYLRADDGAAPIVVTNYEMLAHFDPSAFHGVVIDESSCLKAFDGKTRNEIIAAFASTPMRLACTATPAPNDHGELGNHSEFLGIKTRAEMLAEYFVHDGETTSEWRLKGHARDAFWRWVASWGAVIGKPSDLGHADDGYDLPPLRMVEHVLPIDIADAHRAGALFAAPVSTLSDQRANRRATASKRVAKAADIAGDGRPCLVWCELNSEQDAIEAALGELAFSVRGSDSLDEKVASVMRWVDGERPAMISKTSIVGFGMNFQHCARQVFLGASHSYEQTYQAIRRSWRFGQTQPVDIHIIRAENEGAIVANYRRKEADAQAMAAEMRKHSRAAVRSEVQGVNAKEWNEHNAWLTMDVPSWLSPEVT